MRFDAIEYNLSMYMKYRRILETLDDATSFNSQLFWRTGIKCARNPLYFIVLVGEDIFYVIYINKDSMGLQLSATQVYEEWGLDIYDLEDRRDVSTFPMYVWSDQEYELTTGKSLFKLRDHTVYDYNPGSSWENLEKTGLFMLSDSFLDLVFDDFKEDALARIEDLQIGFIRKIREGFSSVGCEKEWNNFYLFGKDAWIIALSDINYVSIDGRIAKLGLQTIGRRVVYTPGFYRVPRAVIDSVKFSTDQESLICNISLNFYDADYLVKKF